MKAEKVFTKWDLVVVLGCVGFIFLNLAAIGARGRWKAKTLVCANSFKEQWRAQIMYATDNDGKFPYGFNQLYRVADALDTLSSVPSQAKGCQKWEVYRKGYIPNANILLCPILKIQFPGSNQFTRVDYNNNNLYGGWDWEKSPEYLAGGWPCFSVSIPSNWHANYLSDQKPAPAGGGTNFQFDYAGYDGTYRVDEPQWPNKLDECNATGVMISHVFQLDIRFLGGTYLQDFSHGGIGATTVTSPRINDIRKSKVENPLCFGDGHVEMWKKANFKCRAMTNRAYIYW